MVRTQSDTNSHFVYDMGYVGGVSPMSCTTITKLCGVAIGLKAILMFSGELLDFVRRTARSWV
jgi:hypothetical protein